MKVVLPGGTGQVGTVLARAFHGRGDEVVVLSRSAHAGAAPWRIASWDGGASGRPGPWARELEGADVLVNLAGRSVNCRYGIANREAILQSRVRSTRAVGEAIAAASAPPRLWLQASTATIYAHRFDAPNDEETGILGGAEPDAPDTWRFSIEVARAWEEEVDRAVVPTTRKVKLRSAMIMSPDRGGIFDMLRKLARSGLGGPAGDGRQYVSWIHEMDFVRALDWLIEHEDVAGAVNVASPEPLPQRAFMRALREACGVSLGLSATRLMLEIGAFFLRTETELILKSRRVVPGLLLKRGFTFRFPRWPEAAADLCASANERPPR